MNFEITEKDARGKFVDVFRDKLAEEMCGEVLLIAGTWDRYATTTGPVDRNRRRCLFCGLKDMDWKVLVDVGGFEQKITDGGKTFGKWILTSHSARRRKTGEFRITNIQTGGSVGMSVSNMGTVRNSVIVENRFLCGDSCDKKLYIWDLETRNKEQKDVKGKFKLVYNSNVHSNVQTLWVRDMIYYKQFHSLVFGHSKSSFKMFDMNVMKSNYIFRAKFNKGYTHRVAFSQAHNLWIGNCEHRVNIWDHRTQENTLGMKFTNSRTCILYEDQNKLILQGQRSEHDTRTRRMRIYDFRKISVDGENFICEKMLEGSNRYVGFSTLEIIDENLFASGFTDSTLMSIGGEEKCEISSGIFDSTNLECVKALPFKKEWITAMKKIQIGSNSSKLESLDLKERVSFIFHEFETVNTFCIRFTDRDIVINKILILF